MSLYLIYTFILRYVAFNVNYLQHRENRIPMYPPTKFKKFCPVSLFKNKNFKYI